jgi:hypothetical protein
MTKIKALIVSAFLFLTPNLYGAYLFSPSVSYLEQKLHDNSLPDTKAKYTAIDLRFGYLTEFGLYVGGLYSLHDQNILADASDSYFGPSIGYFYSGFLFVGTWFVYGERDLSNGQTKYANVGGYQLDLSYAIPLNETISIGPQLSYIHVDFNEAQNAGNANTTDYNFNGIVPYFNITFQF